MAGVLLVAGVSATAGWTVRGRIAANIEAGMQAKIEQLQHAVELCRDRAAGWQRDYETAKRSAAALERAVAEQNAALERLEAAHARAEARRRSAEARLRDYMARPPDPVLIMPGTCEEMVEQARKLGGGR